MKNIILIISILFHSTLYCQVENNTHNKTPLTINAGAGYPELLHIGARCHFSQFQFGASIGGTQKKRQTSASGDIFLHFGRVTDYTELKPWYTRLGYNFLKEKAQYSTFEYSQIILRIGRDLYLNEHIGINLDLGVALRVYQHEYNKNYPPPEPLNSFDDITFFPNGIYGPQKVWPSAVISLFYRI